MPCRVPISTHIVYIYPWSAVKRVPSQIIASLHITFMYSIGILRHESGNGDDGNTETAHDTTEESRGARNGDVIIAVKLGDSRNGLYVEDGAKETTVVRDSLDLDRIHIYQDWFNSAPDPTVFVSQKSLRCRW